MCMINIIAHPYALFGNEYPLVRKSAPFGFEASSPLEKRLFRFSFKPSFLRLLICACSSRTLAVRAAVAAFLIAPADVDVASCSLFSAFSPFVLPFILSVLVSASASACFFLFFPPAAFFNECVRPASFKFCIRSSSFVISSFATGSIVMTFSGAYGSLHCIQTSPATSLIATSAKACPQGTRYTDFVVGPNSLLVIGHILFSSLEPSSLAVWNLTSTMSRRDFTRPWRTSSCSPLRSGEESSLGSRCSMIASLL